jgi:large subunit ribosomal protein L31
MYYVQKTLAIPLCSAYKSRQKTRTLTDPCGALTMKQDIHPDYHEITVVMTDGTEYKTRTTWGKAGDVMRLDVDPKTHPAWQGGTGKVVEKAQLKKFESRFGTFLSGGAGNSDTAKKSDKKDGTDGKAA